MITPNIESLSLSELRYIAHKQGVDDAQVLDREELMEAIQDFYEEMDDGSDPDSSSYSPSTQQRFMNTLVEYDSGDWVGPLPGVQRLPEGYTETRIHIMLKDPYWAHAYWSVCPADILRLEQADAASFFLRVNMHPSSASDGDSFDIDVKKNDTSWNVNLPQRGRTYSVSLHYRDGSGNEAMLCQSTSVTTPTCHWLDRPDALGQDDTRFQLLFSALVSKGGVMVDNPLLREIVDRLDDKRRS